MKNLIGMTDFVLEQNSELKNTPDAYYEYCDIVNHAKFISQPLTLGMFVPAKLVDGVWIVLEEPEIYKITANTGNSKEELEYIEAKSKVIFEGFVYDWHMEYCQNGSISFDEEFLLNKTIEDLVPYNLIMK